MADFDFCFINGQYCNALSYLVSNNNGINPLNQYYKPLINGSCSADQFLVSDDAWNNIYQGPPISLTENYKQCNKKSSSAFTAAAGIAAANMYTLIPFISLFLVHVYLCLCIHSDAQANSGDLPGHLRPGRCRAKLGMITLPPRDRASCTTSRNSSTVSSKALWDRSP